MEENKYWLCTIQGANGTYTFVTGVHPFIYLTERISESKEPINFPTILLMQEISYTEAALYGKMFDTYHNKYPS